MERHCRGAVKAEGSDAVLETGMGVPVGNSVDPQPEQLAKSDLTWRLAIFAAFTVILAIAFRHSLMDLVRLSMKDETYSHMPLIPLVSAYLLFDRRRRIFAEVQTGLLPGVLVAGLGLFLWLVSYLYPDTTSFKNNLSQSTLAVLIAWFGGFILLFGLRSFHNGSFPLLFLLFLVPFPLFLLDWIVGFLRHASTEVASVLFTLTGVPVLRDGFLFELPGMTMLVADECCGIRSSISLFITGVLAAHLALKSPWRRTLLILAVLPITIFKNALRILTLSLLAVYVDERIIHGALHRIGGIPFFGLALLIFCCVLWVLRRSDVNDVKGTLQPAAPAE